MIICLLPPQTNLLPSHTLRFPPHVNKFCEHASMVTALQTTLLSPLQTRNVDSEMHTVPPPLTLANSGLVKIRPSSTTRNFFMIDIFNRFNNFQTFVSRQMSWNSRFHCRIRDSEKFATLVIPFYVLVKHTNLSFSVLPSHRRAFSSAAAGKAAKTSLRVIHIFSFPTPAGFGLARSSILA